MNDKQKLHVGNIRRELMIEFWQQNNWTINYTREENAMLS